MSSLQTQGSCHASEKGGGRHQNTWSETLGGRTWREEQSDRGKSGEKEVMLNSADDKARRWRMKTERSEFPRGLDMLLQQAFSTKDVCGSSGENKLPVLNEITSMNTKTHD